MTVVSMRKIYGCGVVLLAVLAVWTGLAQWSVQADDREPAGTPEAKSGATAGQARDRKDPAIGRRVPNFVLPDPSGKQVGLADFREKTSLILVFLNCQCPISNQYIPVLNELASKFADRGVGIVAINSHAGDSPEKIAKHQADFKLAFPVLCDGHQQAADILGAERTGEVFLLDPQRFVRYHGRIDDRFQYTTKRDEPQRHDLVLALEALLAGRDIEVQTTEVQGCLFGRSQPRTTKGEITYSKQIARIIQQKCQDCHHPDTAAPFALLTYQDAVNWAAMMKEVILQRRMPPWHADSRFGEFSEERRLTQAEIDQVLAWMNDGMPEGNPADLPPTIDYPDGWRIGEPDVVYEIPKEVTIPAKGTVPYIYFETPTNFKEDMYIQAAEARPGNRAVVHHIVLFYKEPGGKGGQLFENWIDGAAPGNVPLVLPEGTGRRIPAGATLVWQMHYTATGKEEKDLSKYAFRFCKQKPEREARVLGIRNERFRIPPGDPNFRVDSKFRAPRDLLLYSFAPHMHVRGKDFEYRAVYPDGRTEILLSIPQYDFNWQSAYRLKSPKLIPAGTTIECTAHFDNSKGNPANPDPSKTVGWGDQTWQEMMIGYVDCITADPETAK
ncbi:MAG: redoxin domain-containing protein [Planctomycetes bacterium]|nr:redoxin domain-containing protein [Planctomycetota bacterium]